MNRLFVRLSQSLDGSRSLEELVRSLLELLESVTGLDSTYLTTIDAAAQRQRVLYARNTGALDIREGNSMSWQDSLCRRALEEGRTQCDDVPDRWPEAPAVKALGLQTYVSVPVRATDGSLLGTLCAAGSGRHVIDSEAEHASRVFSRLIAHHLEREHLVERLRLADEALTRSALSDPLTGLPNRRSLANELGRMLARVQRDDRALVVACIHLDGFRAINDRHGHDGGDGFLVAIARALETALRGGDLVARIGSDEFVVAGTVPRENAEAAADVLRMRLQAATQGRFDIGEGNAIDYDGASVGAVLARTGEVDADALLARADRATYEARRERAAAI